MFVCVFGLLCFSSENSAFNSRFILSNFQLLTDNVSYSIGNAGKKIQYTTHQPRNGIGQILSQDQCQVRGCLDYLPMVCIRVIVSSQDLKAVALNAMGQTGKTAPGDLFHFVRVYYWTTVEWKELLPGSSLSHLDYRSRIHNLYLVFGIGNVAITISMVLLPCAVSSAWTWVNQPLTLVQRLG